MYYSSTNRVAAKIRSLREYLNLSQDRFGSKLGISGKTVSAYETGRSAPSYRVMEKISAVYRISMIEQNLEDRVLLKDKVVKLDQELDDLKKLLSL